MRAITEKTRLGEFNKVKVMQEINLKTQTNTPIIATLFEVHKDAPVVLIASATGVKQSYYHNFAHYLYESGYNVITFDYVGIGASLHQDLNKLQYTASQWATDDLETVLQFVLQNYPNSQKTVLGHSIGGQLTALAPSITQVDKIILIAAQSGYWKHWKGTTKWQMWFNWYILFPVLLKSFKYLPSKKFTGMENLPHGVAKQWRNWCVTPNYYLQDQNIPEFYFENITIDITAFSISDDAYAPKTAVSWLLQQYANAKNKHIHWDATQLSSKKIGHFGIFKNRNKETLWKDIQNEIKR